MSPLIDAGEPSSVSPAQWLCRLGVHRWDPCPDPTVWQCPRCWATTGRW